ncbi:hypothetical protein ACX27_18115 [Nostoc piscinale CENA21]|uniref:General stress protein 17M-like domain-containing protein n=1 Tax=Nostoc piscinale CENA21 TaxID=224013 RepID=A0A0M3V5Q4_9NOSO|nr:general stress protein [Nostoc piscinale]ALF54323.1 hypothetical protein ACX27_18115 [Nostoc piscinale CENA21]
MVTKNSIYALGVFTKAQELEKAINDLQASGFPLERVSVIAKDVKQGESIGEAPLSDRIGDQDVNVSSPVGNTLTATSWGTLLLGLSSLALPGLGAVLAAGSVGVALATSVAGVAVGAAANQNLVKAFTDLGIPEERARIYSDRLQQSYYLLILEGTESEIQRAEPILREQDIQNWGVYQEGLGARG